MMNKITKMACLVDGKIVYGTFRQYIDNHNIKKRSKKMFK